MYFRFVETSSLLILWVFLTSIHISQAVSTQSSPTNQTNHNTTADQPTGLPTITGEPNSPGDKSITEEPHANKRVVVGVTSHKKEESKPKRSHKGRVAAAAIIGVLFTLSVCGAVFYKAYKSNSEQNNAAAGYSHPTNRLSNCLELQSATPLERRPIMQTAIETEGIEGIEPDEPAYDV